MESAILQQIVIIFGLAIGVLLLCHRLHIPGIVGFLFTGLFCGPHGVGLIAATDDVQLLADIGIILLLFTVGMEFSLKKLLEYKRFFFLGGGIQVFLTCLIGVVVAQFLQRPLGESIFLGCLLSLSSTAIVIRSLDTRHETTTPHGRVILGILIFQDIAAVPMMLVTPYLAGVGQEFRWEFFAYFLQGVFLLLIVFLAAIKLVPRLMHLIARTRSRELFLLTTLSICFSVAWITASIGLSLALGAFLAGLIISESEYRTEAIEDILPFRNIFTSLFFISIGMLLDLEFVLKELPLITLITIGVLLLKSSIASLVTLIVGMPLRTALLVGITLSQVGEFSFVLARSGMDAGIATGYLYQLFLSVAVITMALTPSMIIVAPALVKKMLKLPFPEKLKMGLHPLVSEKSPVQKEHVVIIGYGLPGQLLASTCKETDTPYVIIEIDPNVIQKAREKGEPIYFADATHRSALRQLHIEKASVVAIMTNDPLATLRIVEHIRHLNEDAYLIVRTGYMDEIKPLYQLGADEVIPDEFGAAIEVFSRVLYKYHISEEEIDRIIASKREQGLSKLHQQFKDPHSLADIQTRFSELGVRAVDVTEKSQLVGTGLKEAGLTQDYGVHAVMIRRGGANIHHLEENTVIEAGDKLVLVGPFENLKRIIKEIV